MRPAIYYFQLQNTSAYLYCFTYYTRQPWVFMCMSQLNTIREGYREGYGEGYREGYGGGREAGRGLPCVTDGSQRERETVII